MLLAWLCCKMLFFCSGTFILTWVYWIVLLISLIYYSTPFEEDLWLSFQVALKELQIAEMPTDDKLPQIHWQSMSHPAVLALSIHPPMKCHVKEHLWLGWKVSHLLTWTRLKHFPQSKDTACINRAQEMKKLETPAEEHYGRCKYCCIYLGAKPFYN